MSSQCRMPYRKKRAYRKKRMTRKTPYGRRRKFIRRSSKSLTVMRESVRDGTNFCHMQFAGSASGSSSVLSTTFNMSDMAGSGELKSLFDNYRINSVAWRWALARDEDYTTVNAGSYVRINQVKDFNDQVPPTAAQLRQYANYKEIVFKGNQSVTKWMYMKPASLQLFYLTSVTSATGPVWGRFIDTSQDTLPHYSLKFQFENFYTGATLRLEVKINATFKGIS